jgi:hypothetical protein
MRSFVGLLVAAVLFFVIYRFALNKMPSTDEGTAATQAITLTGVRGDLLQIAMAERLYIATNAQCASLDELISSNALSMTRTERDGYSYAVECSGLNFTAAARHTPAPAGSSIRYPNLSIDSSLQVHDID